MENTPFFWGIRHLSPAGAFYLREFLDEVKPKCVLIEGPSDFNDVIPDIVRKETVPPIAVMAYTKQAPIRTILYPFAEYSPEYQAIVWCHKNKIQCKFIDMPSETFLAVTSADTSDSDNNNNNESVYEKLDSACKFGGHETFWECTMEHVADINDYHEGANEFGKRLREITAGADSDWPETVAREAYMRSEIRKCVSSGIKPEEIVVVCGSFHVDGLLSWQEEESIEGLPKIDTLHTLMPYSYYRLSSRSGYGAGNKAPAYYYLLWEGLNKKDPSFAMVSYLSRIASHMRSNGNPVSTASVIEAVRLAKALASLREDKVVSLSDLRDAAATCFGEGSYPVIGTAIADTEIGTTIGSLPDGVSRTSIQEDFYHNLKIHKLEKYKSIVSEDLVLDLRENRRVKSKEAAFLDLNRSFFLHRLRVLDIDFANLQKVNQDNATYAEKWIVKWSAEVEIRIVEAALKGDTVKLAAIYQLAERLDKADGINDIAKVLEDSFLCGLSELVLKATKRLQALAVDAASVKEIAECLDHLSAVVSFGNIRQVTAEPLVPIMEQLFYHYCMILPGACSCDETASSEIIDTIELVNKAVHFQDFLEMDQWQKVINELAIRDDLNTKISGFAMSILLEQGVIKGQELNNEVSRRLSKGIPADLGAGWFEGLAMKNRYSLINRLSLWQTLDDYLETLDDEEFKRALLFLRRAFADFSAVEKDQIAENLGENWGLNKEMVSEVVNAPLGEEAQQLVESLGDFDFDL